MKKLLLSILLLSCSAATFAQSTAKKSSVFIGLGPSISIGDFSSKDTSDNKAGLAATGFYIDLGYQYQFSKNVGVIAILKGRTNGIVKEVFDYRLPDGSGSNMSVTTTAWKMGSFLAGLTQTFALSKSEIFSVEFREAAGVQFTSSPEINMSFNIPGVASGYGKQDSQSATSFVYLLGLGFKYQLNSNLGLKLYGDFNNSNAKFKEFIARNGDNMTTVPSSTQKTGTIDVGLGLTIGF